MVASSWIEVRLGKSCNLDATHLVIDHEGRIPRPMGTASGNTWVKLFGLCPKSQDGPVPTASARPSEPPSRHYAEGLALYASLTLFRGQQLRSVAVAAEVWAMLLDDAGRPIHTGLNGRTVSIGYEQVQPP